MTIGILREPSFESRVSLLPEHVSGLKKLNVDLIAETGCGLKAFNSDKKYEEAGAEILSRKQILNNSDLLLTINPLVEYEFSELKNGVVIVGMFNPLVNYDLLKDVSTRNFSLFSLDMLPRTTRAQSMDVLSSQANIAGYRAVLTAALHLPKYFPMFMTAAGSVSPAKVLILGAGVAGLQAIATARRLGAVVEVFDTRPSVKEEVMSLGAKFIEVEGAADASAAGGYAVEQTEEYKAKQQQRIADVAIKADVIITTAQIPGRQAPILITESILEKMKAGSVIIDLAASSGGNTARTKNNETVIFNHVKIIGDSNLPSGMPADASKLYGKNIYNFLKLLINEKGELNLNFEDDLVKGACICHDGEIVNERLKSTLV
ncbi:MAG: Re/Si-specific NAD(P)(+) transhydrogenase subunit alpha [Daejeonella sp.]